MLLSLLCGISMGMSSCKQREEVPLYEKKSIDQEYKRQNHINNTSRSETTQVYNVEVFGKNGDKFKGEVVFRGENAAGYIFMSDKERVFIDVKESMDGGYEALDLNGNKYFLLLMR